MASPLGKLFRLLSEGTIEQRIAATIVIGELVPSDTAVVKRLAEAAADEDHTLRLKAIEALGKVGNAEAREALYPFLDAEGDVKRAAIAAVARTGNPAVSFVKKAFAEAPMPKKRTLIQVLSAIATKEAMAFLLHILQDPNVAIVRDAVTIFREETGALESKSSRQLSAQIRATLGTKTFGRNRNAVEAAVLMLNHLRDPRSAKVLLEFSSPDRPATLRRCALQGLRWVLPEQPEQEEAVRLLLGYLEDDDFQNIVSPALEALQPLPVPRSAADALIPLAESRHPLVRKFALSKMSEVGQTRVIETLVGALADPDPMIRELASRSLHAQSGAWKTVVQALETCTDVDLAWRMVHAVRAEVSKVPLDELNAVMKKAIDRLESDDAMAEPLLNLVQTLASDLHFEALYKRAIHWKRKRDFAKAELCLRPLTRSQSCTDEARFELAIMSLKNSTATAGAIARDSDLSLALVKGLIKNSEFPLLKRLNGENKVLEPPDYYYLGFHLVEGTHEERVIGAEILENLVKTTPRSRVGRSAKSKLRLENLLK